MDKYASNFFVTRVLGARAAGYVRIYFRTPRTLYLAPGTYFETAGGKRFNLVGSYSVTEAQMRSNITAYPDYSTELIPIIAENYGSEYETGPNTITKVVGLTVEYAYVRNPVAITGGVSRETNTQLKDRVLNSAINGSVLSDRGIQTLLTNNFPSLTDVVVKGAGDDEMKRDLIYSVASGEVLSTLPANFYRSDFLGAISGYQIYPANRSRGVWGIFNVYLTSGITIRTTDIPSPDHFTDEWTTPQYMNVYRPEGGYYQTITSQIILNEMFAGDAANNDGWTANDATTADNGLKHPKEIRVSGGRLILGDLESFTYEDRGFDAKERYYLKLLYEELEKLLEEVGNGGDDER
jgi:hypothetical protein